MYYAYLVTEVQSLYKPTGQHIIIIIIQSKAILMYWTKFLETYTEK
jgi:hypothetical protein